MPENFNQIPNRQNKPPSIAELYPQLSAAEQAAAEEKWRRYLRVVRRIFEYIGEEHPEILTELEQRVMLRKQRADKK
jgi:hypothetical protein